jgi:hypothetical protein
MKKSIYLLILLGILFSCNKNDNETTTNSALVGSWKLTAILADPGNGNGIFNPVISNKTIVFDNNGNLSSNGTICDMSTDSNTSSTGNYIEANTSIISSSCQNLTIKYELSGNTLILNYPCIEPCKAKYIKIN